MKFNSWRISVVYEIKVLNGILEGVKELELFSVNS